MNFKHTIYARSFTSPRLEYRGWECWGQGQRLLGPVEILSLGAVARGYTGAWSFGFRHRL